MKREQQEKRGHRTFEDRIAGFDGEYVFEEWDTGEPVGKERFWEEEDSESMRKEYDFSNAAPPFFTEANQVRLQKAMEQLETGKGTAHDLIEIDDG